VQLRSASGAITQNNDHQAVIMRPWSLFFTEYSGKIIEAASHKKGEIRTFLAIFKIPKKPQKNQSGENIGEKSGAGNL
jgi:hypothetical protein